MSDEKREYIEIRKLVPVNGEKEFYDGVKIAVTLCRRNMVQVVVKVPVGTSIRKGD